MAQNGEVDFSSAVLEAFQKRQRAFSRRGAPVECTPVKEIVDGRESEIGRTDVRIEFRVDRARITLRLQVWGDRWVWVDARRSAKFGWVWESTSEGRFVSPGGARDLVAHVEETLSAAHLPIADVPRAISAIWSRCLAVGLRSV
jgi:hypothetical protein